MHVETNGEQNYVNLLLLLLAKLKVVGTHEKNFLSTVENNLKNQWKSFVKVKVGTVAYFNATINSMKFYQVNFFPVSAMKNRLHLIPDLPNI